jgi:hypothetical protein
LKKEERLRILWDAVDTYKGMGFIEKDPISIPHRFRLKQDIEIAAFFFLHYCMGTADYRHQECQ